MAIKTSRIMDIRTSRIEAGETIGGKITTIDSNSNIPARKRKKLIPIDGGKIKTLRKRTPPFP